MDKPINQKIIDYKDLYNALKDKPTTSINLKQWNIFTKLYEWNEKDKESNV